MRIIRICFSIVVLEVREVFTYYATLLFVLEDVGTSCFSM